MGDGARAPRARVREGGGGAGDARRAHLLELRLHGGAVLTLLDELVGAELLALLVGMDAG